jgi:hypothetical protein
VTGTTRLQVPRIPIPSTSFPNTTQIAGFFTGGALAIRGGYKAARNGAISCAILLAVIEGVGIGFQKMFAGATKLEVSGLELPPGLAYTDFPRSRHHHHQTKRSSHRPATTMSYDSPDTPNSSPPGRHGARMCISLRIYDGQHLGGGVPCIIEPVGYALPRGRVAARPKTSADICGNNIYPKTSVSMVSGRAVCLSHLT